jgi:hypothetical protein
MAGVFYSEQNHGQPYPCCEVAQADGGGGGGVCGGVFMEDLLPGTRV